MYRFHDLIFYFSICIIFFISSCGHESVTQEFSQPNILLAIADDHSWLYNSDAYTSGIKTPVFDELTKRGILFQNAFVASPQCSPSRAAILTGKNIWQLEEAGTHASYFPKKFPVFTDLLEQSGYKLGYTGKPWAPGNWKDAGWERNPVGNEFNSLNLDSVPSSGIHSINYVENFKVFYEQKEKDKPFFFWYGAFEPHRPYEAGSGNKSDLGETDAIIPEFLPDVPPIREDILDYFFEISWFDKQLGEMLDFLKYKGDLENTIIIVTADNGMPFPAAKANLMEYGTHVPLLISWPLKIKGSIIVKDLISLIDLAPTLLDIVGTGERPEMTGKSFAALLFDGTNLAEYKPRDYVLTGRERHTHARPDNLGYPSRAIRNSNYLYIWNIKPERWPAGNPMPPGTKENTPNAPFRKLWPGYHDVDDSPSKSFLLKHKMDFENQFAIAFSKRPGEQLYDVQKDPACTVNLAEEEGYQQIKFELRDRLKIKLKEQKDPRILGYGDIFESYPRISSMRMFPGFRQAGVYNPAFLQDGQVTIK